MEYWNFQKNDERKKSSCSELTTIDHIDEHLAHERNKNYYLMKKNESLRNSNQQFAVSYESLKMQLNELLLERTALFQKNVSLLYEQNHLKKELLTCKEMLNKTSSRNKALLLNLKSAYDEGVKSTSYLDEYITSLPHDNVNMEYEKYEDYAENDPIFELNSPRWNKIYPINTALTPVKEEQPCQVIEPLSCGTKSRLGRNPLKRIDNVINFDKISDIKSINWDPNKENRAYLDLKQDYCFWRSANLQAKELMTAYEEEEIELPVKLKESDDYINNVESFKKESNNLLKTSNRGVETDEIKSEKKITLNEALNVTKHFLANENESISNVRQVLMEDKPSRVQDEPKSYQFSDFHEIDSFQCTRSFFPPVHDENEPEKLSKVQDISDKLPPATPISVCKTKIIGTPGCRDFSSLSTIMRSLEVQANQEVPSICLKNTPKDKSFVNKSLSKSISIRVANKTKRKVNERKLKPHELKSRKKKRKSVFDIVYNEENDLMANNLPDQVNKNPKINIAQEEEIDNKFFKIKDSVLQANVNDEKASEEINENKEFNCIPRKKMVEARSNDIELQVDTPLKSKARSWQRKVSDNNEKVKTTACTRSKRKLDDPAAVLKEGVETRTRSKKKKQNDEEQDCDKIIGDEKRTTRSKSKKNQQVLTEAPHEMKVTRGRVQKNRKINAKQLILTNENKNQNSPTPKINNYKDNADHNRYLPISTPKSIIDLSQPINFNEISISPIGKMLKDNDHKHHHKNFGGSLIQNEPVKMTNEGKTMNCKNQKKYVVLSDLLKATANHKVATSEDVAQIKRFLVNIGCSDKKTEKKVVVDPVIAPVEELKEDFVNISDNMLRDNITSLLSTLSPSLASIIKSLDIEDNSTNVQV